MHLLQDVAVFRHGKGSNSFAIYDTHPSGLWQCVGALCSYEAEAWPVALFDRTYLSRKVCYLITDLRTFAPVREHAQMNQCRMGTDDLFNVIFSFRHSIGRHAGIASLGCNYGLNYLFKGRRSNHLYHLMSLLSHSHINLHKNSGIFLGSEITHILMFSHYKSRHKKRLSRKAVRHFACI